MHLLRSNKLGLTRYRNSVDKRTVIENYDLVVCNHIVHFSCAHR